MIRATRTAVTRAAAVKILGMGLPALVALALMVGAPGPVRAAGADAKPSFAARHFLQDMDDVPLMTGLAERPAPRLVFETAAGRIVDAEAVSGPAAKLTSDRVMSFYRRALAALGWRPLGRGRFAREGEILSITTATADHGLRVRFSLRPK